MYIYIYWCQYLFSRRQVSYNLKFKLLITMERSDTYQDLYRNQMLMGSKNNQKGLYIDDGTPKPSSKLDMNSPALMYSSVSRPHMHMHIQSSKSFGTFGSLFSQQQNSKMKGSQQSKNSSSINNISLTSSQRQIEMEQKRRGFSLSHLGVGRQETEASKVSIEIDLDAKYGKEFFKKKQRKQQVLQNGNESSNVRTLQINSPTDHKKQSVKSTMTSLDASHFKDQTEMNNMNQQKNDGKQIGKGKRSNIIIQQFKQHNPQLYPVDESAALRASYQIQNLNLQQPAQFKNDLYEQNQQHAQDEVYQFKLKRRKFKSQTRRQQSQNQVAPIVTSLAGLSRIAQSPNVWKQLQTPIAEQNLQINSNDTNLNQQDDQETSDDESKQITLMHQKQIFEGQTGKSLKQLAISSKYSLQNSKFSKLETAIEESKFAQSSAASTGSDDEVIFGGPSSKQPSIRIDEKSQRRQLRKSLASGAQRDFNQGGRTSDGVGKWPSLALKKGEKLMVNSNFSFAKPAKTPSNFYRAKSIAGIKSQLQSRFKTNRSSDLLSRVNPSSNGEVIAPDMATSRNETTNEPPQTSYQDEVQIGTDRQSFWTQKPKILSQRKNSAPQIWQNPMKGSQTLVIFAQNNYNTSERIQNMKNELQQQKYSNFNVMKFFEKHRKSLEISKSKMVIEESNSKFYNNREELNSNQNDQNQFSNTNQDQQIEPEIIQNAKLQQQMKQKRMLQKNRKSVDWVRKNLKQSDLKHKQMIEARQKYFRDKQATLYNIQGEKNFTDLMKPKVIKKPLFDSYWQENGYQDSMQIQEAIKGQDVRPLIPRSLKLSDKAEFKELDSIKKVDKIDGVMQKLTGKAIADLSKKPPQINDLDEYKGLPVREKMILANEITQEDVQPISQEGLKKLANDLLYDEFAKDILDKNYEDMTKKAEIKFGQPSIGKLRQDKQLNKQSSENTSTVLTEQSQLEKHHKKLFRQALDQDQIDFSNEPQFLKHLRQNKNFRQKRKSEYLDRIKPQALAKLNFIKGEYAEMNQVFEKPDFVQNVQNTAIEMSQREKLSANLTYRLLGENSEESTFRPIEQDERLARKIPTKEEGIKTQRQDARIGQWGPIQIVNLDTATNSPERVKGKNQAAVLKLLTQQVLEAKVLPFGSIFDCYRESGSKSKYFFHFDIALTNAATYGIKEALFDCEQYFNGISLKQTGLNDEGVQQILQGAISRRVQEFSLENTHLGNLSCSVLYNYFCDKNTNIKKLKVVRCKVKAQEIDKILQVLIMNPSHATDKPFVRDLNYSASVDTLKKFAKLDQKVPQTISTPNKSINLRTLNLRSSNLFSSDYLVEIIQKCLFLEKLDLANNIFKRSQLVPLILSLCDAQRLKHCDLSGNNLGGNEDAAPCLALLLRNSLSLLHIDLSYTSILKAEEHIQIFTAISESQTIQSAHFLGNKLPSRKLIFNEICHIMNLRQPKKTQLNVVADNEIDQEDLNASQPIFDDRTMVFQRCLDGYNKLQFLAKGSAKGDGLQRWFLSDCCWICSQSKIAVFLFNHCVKKTGVYLERDHRPRISQKIYYRNSEPDFVSKLNLITPEFIESPEINETQINSKYQNFNFLNFSWIDNMKSQGIFKKQEDSFKNKRGEEQWQKKSLQKTLQMIIKDFTMIDLHFFEHGRSFEKSTPKKSIQETWFVNFALVKPDARYSIEYRNHGGPESQMTYQYDYLTTKRRLNAVQTQIENEKEASKLVCVPINKSNRFDKESLVQKLLTQTHLSMAASRYTEPFGLIIDKSFAEAYKMQVFSDTLEINPKARRSVQIDTDQMNLFDILSAEYGKNKEALDKAREHIEDIYLDHFQNINYLFAQCVNLVPPDKYPVVTCNEIYEILVKKHAIFDLEKDRLIQMLGKICKHARIVEDDPEDDFFHYDQEIVEYQETKGVLRNQMVILMIQNAKICYPKTHLVSSFALLMENQIQIACKDVESPFKEEIERAQIDWMIAYERDFVDQILLKLKRVDASFIQRTGVLKMFGQIIFPNFAQLIINEYNLCQSSVNENPASLENVHEIDEIEFYEFLVRIARALVRDKVPLFIKLEILLQIIKQRFEKVPDLPKLKRQNAKKF